MNYKIVVDSCCELPAEYLQDEHFERIPLGLEIGDYHILDDDGFDQADFLKRVALSPQCPKSSCPSPDKYLDAYRTVAERIYVVTLSSGVSGSYNSALVGRDLFLEEYKDKKLLIVDSGSASCGETQIALKLRELEEEGCPFEEIVKRIAAFKDELNTYFVLENLDTLHKNGRLTGVKALVASTLNIKPIMGAQGGVIVQRGQAVGIRKAVARMADMVVSECRDSSSKHLIISHCNAAKRAETLRDLILLKATFKSVIILNTAGISSMYANEGGVIVSV